MTERATLRDVADRAGVHISTASRALNPRTRDVVNARTLKKVLAAAEALDYRPDQLARSLRTSRSTIVGIVIPDVENPLFGPIVAGAESRLNAYGYSLLIGNADGGPDHTEAVASMLLDRRVDGLILASAVRSDSLVANLAAKRVPMVLVNRTDSADLVPSIVGDDYFGIGLAMTHLIELGHRRIGHVAGPLGLSTGVARRDAFIDWSRKAGLDSPEDRVEVADSFQVDAGWAAGDKLLSRHPDLTAIVASNDLLGLGCYRAIRSLGKEVGVDVSVTGYNDIPLLELTHPPMTAVRVPYRSMGERAADVLLDLLDGKVASPDVTTLTPDLVVRGSTGRPHDSVTAGASRSVGEDDPADGAAVSQ